MVSWVVSLSGLASRPPSFSDDEDADVVARREPAADNALRLELEGDLLQPLGHCQPIRWSLVPRVDQPLGDELFAGEEVDGGDFAGQPVQVRER